MDSQLTKKLDQYYDKFGDIFPTMIYALPSSKLIEVIDDCISENKKVGELIPMNYSNDRVY